MAGQVRTAATRQSPEIGPAAPVATARRPGSPRAHTGGSPPDRPDRRPPRSAEDDRRLGAVLLVLAAVWSLIGGYVVHSQLPTSAVELPGQAAIRAEVPKVAPQGWAFFTRSAREEQLLAWQPDSAGGWRPAMLAPHSEPRNAFGLNRRSRAQAVEIGLLTAATPEAQWRACDGDVLACVAAIPARAALPVDNVSPDPTLCGPVAMSRQEPLPWAWADFADTAAMPATVIRLEVSC